MLANIPIDHNIFRERREHCVYHQLLQTIPGLEERLINGSEEDTVHMAELVCWI
jgi:hypothetical protein